MNGDIDRIIRNSNKAQLLEKLAEELEKADAKVIVVLIDDKEGGGYSSTVMTLGIENTYEAYGILEVARQDLQDENY